MPRYSLETQGIYVEARKDAADREAIVAALREQLRNGDKSLVGNKGYLRYLGGDGSPHFEVDEAKVAEDARHDGKWVLRTSTELDTAEVALQYKRHWTVEHCIRLTDPILMAVVRSPRTDPSAPRGPQHGKTRWQAA